MDIWRLALATDPQRTRHLVGRMKLNEDILKESSKGKLFLARSDLLNIVNVKVAFTQLSNE